MYKKPLWSKQLCELMRKNLINSIDVMEYTSIIEGKKLPHLKELILKKVNQLYNERIN
jgi:hypothetical protein